jgi:hypothetical protein
VVIVDAYIIKEKEADSSPVAEEKRNNVCSPGYLLG